MPARLTSSHFVGRVGELAELGLAWREAAAGRPLLMLLGGESGLGKTRLVSEFEHRLTAAEAVVLRGEGVDQGQTELPYAPLLSALRPLVRAQHPALAALSHGSRGQLGTLLPGLADGGGIVDSRDGSGQLRLFEALMELIGLLSDAQPLLLVLEDMHWADSSTRTFVSFLVRSLREERVMVLLSYRSDELHRRHPLRPLLSELERLERCRRIELAPFDRSELAEALSDILGDRPEPDLVARLHARSEGNPLYTEELLAAGLDGRGAAPRSLRDAFMLRVERLSEAAQQAARAIAAARQLDEPTLATVLGAAPTTLQPALREAVAEQVLVAARDGALQFRHALLREAVYDDLLPGERTELHLALARVLEERQGLEPRPRAEQAALIAGHYTAAGAQPAALRAYVVAARAAEAVHAYGEASDLAERALELWPRVAEPERVAEIDHVALLSLAAAAESIGGHDRTRAESLLLAALQELDERSDRVRRAALLGRLARVQWSLNRGLEGIETARSALRTLPAQEASSERALILAWLARTQVLRGRFRDGVRQGEEALRAAVAADNSGAQAEVLNTLGMAKIALGQEQDGIERLRQAIDIAREHDDLEGLVYAYTNLADLLNLRGRTIEALQTAHEGLALIPRWLGRAHDWMRLTVCELAFESGDWATARAHLGPPPEQLVGTLLIFRLVREVDMALGEGDEDRAAAALAQLEPLVAESSEPQWIGVVGAMQGDLRRRRRDLLGARAAVAQALDRLEVCTDDVMRIARVTGIGLRVEADVAQRARDLRERGQERDSLKRARIHMDRLRAAAQEGGPVERAWRATGTAELARARGRPDPAAWTAAAAQWDAVERPYPAALARWRAAEAAVEAGERDAAAAPAAQALQAARRLGSRWLASEVRDLARRGRLELDPGREAGEQDAGPAGDDGAEDPFGLTPRERQVLALIAEGATNRQIGAALYMAEKTASVHVSRILTKLGVRSRTQAAAVAHRQRLA